MNIFRLAGDMTHLLSIVTLLLKIHATKSCAGVSMRTQVWWDQPLAQGYCVMIMQSRYLTDLCNIRLHVIELGCSKTGFHLQPEKGDHVVAMPGLCDQRVSEVHCWNRQPPRPGVVHVVTIVASDQSVPFFVLSILHLLC